MFTSTNTSVPQRAQDISKAKQPLAAAGHPHGFSVTIAADIYEEIAQLAQVIKQQASAIGVNINLKVESQSPYCGKAVFGDSDWLDSTMSLVNYGDRVVPNAFRDAPLTTHGAYRGVTGILGPDLQVVELLVKAPRIFRDHRRVVPHRGRRRSR